MNTKIKQYLSIMISKKEGPETKDFLYTIHSLTIHFLGYILLGVGGTPINIFLGVIICHI